MRASLIRLTLLLSLIPADGRVALATETDQFTTPRVPLADLGPKLSRKVVEIIEADRTGHDPERVLFEWVGRNMLASRPARWERAVRAAEDPVRFRPNLLHSVYRVALSPVPASFLFDSPTAAPWILPGH